MTEFHDVTGTAFIVAEYRAHENAEANPLYVDRIVPLFLDERTRQAADGILAPRDRKITHPHRVELDRHIIRRGTFRLAHSRQRRVAVVRLRRPVDDATIQGQSQISHGFMTRFVGCCASSAFRSILNQKPRYFSNT
jgi:hypothetical protein